VIRGFVKTHSEWASTAHRFELWTSGKFSEAAIALVNAAQAMNPKLDIQIRDADYVLAQAVASKDVGLLKGYKQHFVTHPMREFEEAQKREQRKAEKATARLNRPPVKAPPPLPLTPPASVYIPRIHDSLVSVVAGMFHAWEKNLKKWIVDELRRGGSVPVQLGLCGG
jgi:hypothetical protein